jgi:hypothetical protein
MRRRLAVLVAAAALTSVAAAIATQAASAQTLGIPRTDLSRVTALQVLCDQQGGLPLLAISIDSGGYALNCQEPRRLAILTFQVRLLCSVALRGQFAGGPQGWSCSKGLFVVGPPVVIGV